MEVAMHIFPLCFNKYPPVIQAQFELNGVAFKQTITLCQALLLWQRSGHGCGSNERISVHDYLNMRRSVEWNSAICLKWSQLGAHYILVYLFQLLYMFRATVCQSSRERTVSMRHWYFSLRICLFVWVWNLVVDIAGGKEAEGVWEHGVEENIWT